jgi:outer membrane assembly lipoprotein YfiO
MRSTYRMARFNHIVLNSECHVVLSALGYASNGFLIKPGQRGATGWGAGVIPRLARELRNELPEEKGFSERDLKYMIRFYREYATIHAIALTYGNKVERLAFPTMGCSIQSEVMQFQRTSLFILASLLLAPQLHADPPAAEFKNGHWQPIAPPPAAAVANDPELDHMQQLLDVGDAPAALNVGLYWVKHHSNKAPQRDRALFLISMAKFNVDSGDDRISAYYYLDELMDEYPDSKLFYPALDQQYVIADAYLRGHKGKLFGLPIVPMEDEAIEMLFRIQQRSPGSSMAEKALLRTCDYYYADADYELAHDAYGFFIKTFPRSPQLSSVMLRKAFSSLAQFHGVRFDPTCMIDARAELSEVIAAYPQLAKQENLSAIVAHIDEALARKLLVTGDYYRRTSAPRGAVYVYRYLIDTYPDSPDAATARRVLEGMPKSALADAPPRMGADFNVPQGPIGPPAPGRGS